MDVTKGAPMAAEPVDEMVDGESGESGEPIEMREERGGVDRPSFDAPRPADHERHLQVCCKLRAASCELRAASCQLPAAQAVRFPKLLVASCKLQAAQVRGCALRKRWVAIPRSEC